MRTACLLAILLSLTAALPSQADDDFVRLTLRNPTGVARTERVAVSLGDLPLPLPAGTGLTVADEQGALLPRQLDDLDLSGGPSAEDELVFEFPLLPWETREVVISPGEGGWSQSEALPAEDLWVIADGYRARIAAAGGWLAELTAADGPNLIGAGLYQILEIRGTAAIRQHQGCIAFIVLLVYVGAPAQQEFQRGAVIIVERPVQSRAALFVSSVHIDVSVQQSPDLV